MAKINVDTTTLAADLGEMFRSLEMIRKSVESMDNRYNELTLDWTGKAKNNFTLSYKAAIKDVRSIYKKLDKEYTQLNKICGAYEQCEEDVKQKITGMGW